jgi:GAF domain-containing protein
METLTTQEAISQLSRLEAAFAIALGQICEFTGWHYGEVWLPHSNGTILELSRASWIKSHLGSADELTVRQFQDCSKECILSPGEGLPGRVWLSQHPEWILDVSIESETYFLRNQIAKTFGVKTGLGVPIFVNNQVTAVFVFFMLEVRSVDRVLLERIQVAVSQISEFLPHFLN